MRRLSLCVALALLSTGVRLYAAGGDPKDLRDFSVGMTVDTFPESGYADLQCADDGSIALSSWKDWQKCPADATNLRAVAFRYDQGDTKVAGHPVVLAVLIGAEGRLEAIRIKTDPKVRLFLRKKAFLLGLQAKSRYGDSGWSCVNEQPAADEEPVGGLFVKETCTKPVSGRTITVSRVLLNKTGHDVKDFIGSTTILIQRTDNVL
jgi:hypothetical protein